MTPAELELCIRQHRPDLEIVTPVQEPDVRRIPGMGFMWVLRTEPPAVVAVSEQGTNDWGQRFERRFPISPNASPVADALA